MRLLRRYAWWSLLVLLAVLLGWQMRSTTPEQVLAVACPDIVAGCGLSQAGLHVRFDHHPRPLQKFKMMVELPGAREVYASFNMRGMEMGFNRYRLLPDGPGRWQAEVLLPACVQGRKDWLVLLEADGARYQMSFASD